jgi:hypothetical protein
MFDGEIDAAELANDAFPISDESLPFMEAIEDQSIVDEAVGGRNLTAEEVIPMREILDNPLVLLPHLNHDVSYAFSGMFYKRTTRFDDKLNLAIPIDLRSFTDVMIPLPNLLIMKLSPVFIPPLPKPPDLTHNAIANPPLPPEPPDNVSPPILIVLMIEAFPSFSTTLDAHKLFVYLPNRNKITWSYTSSMYAQPSFNILGLLLIFYFMRSYRMNPTEFILDHVIKVGIQWSGINHVLHVYDLVVKIVFVQHFCGGTLLAYLCENHGSTNELNFLLVDHVTKTFVMWTINSSREKLMHGCGLRLEDIVVLKIDAHIAHYYGMTLQGDLYLVKEWILDKIANFYHLFYHNSTAANGSATQFIDHIPSTKYSHLVKSIFSKILYWRLVNGLSFELFYATFGLTKLVEVGGYNCSSTLSAPSFSSLVCINDYLLKIYAKSVTTLSAVWLIKHSLEKN